MTLEINRMVHEKAKIYRRYAEHGRSIVHYQILRNIVRYFFEIFIFSPNDSPSKIRIFFLSHQKSSFRSRDIQIFVIFSLPFHNFQIQKDKWKWNNL